MLFRDTNGLLIEINKSAFKNDHLYYTKMSEVKGLNANTSENIKIKKATNIGDTISKEAIEKYSTQAIGKLLSSF